MEDDFHKSDLILLNLGSNSTVKRIVYEGSMVAHWKWSPYIEI